MCGMLINEDETVGCLGDDVGFVQLSPRGSEGVILFLHWLRNRAQIRCRGRKIVFKAGLMSLGQTCEPWRLRNRLAIGIGRGDGRQRAW
jgi:hypothetical protein